jgi:hypothetical protein
MFQGGHSASGRWADKLMDKQQSAINNCQILFRQATSLHILNSCNLCQLLLKACLRRQVSQSVTVEQGHETLALQISGLSAAHSVSNDIILTYLLLIMAGANKTVPSRVNQTSGDCAPRLKKSDKALQSRRHYTFAETNICWSRPRYDMIIANSIGPSAVIDTESIALSRASVEGPPQV